MSERRRVVVTGLGTINPIGATVDEFWSNALAGVSGIGPITLFDASDVTTRIAGEVSGFDPDEYMPRRESRRLDRSTQFFQIAAGEALEDAGIAYEEDEPAALRAGVLVGSGIGGISTTQAEIDIMRERGAGRVSPLAITKVISNMPGGVVSIAFHLYGPNSTTVTACAASANAIGDAAEIIRRGAADVMVAGGTEAAICEFAVAGFCASRAMSTRNDDPTSASRPFDADRDGFVMGEGSAALVLESLENAQQRGAHIYGEILGYGMSADAYHITLPRPGGDGARRAMVASLEDAGLVPEDIDYINAHGTSTAANDATETIAIKNAFGDAANTVAISSTKSMTGHLLGGAGAVEALVCLLAMRDATVPPTINYETPDPDCDLDYVPNVAREMPVRYAMSNSFGFGGHNVALTIGAFTD
ncbi:3-oxoacyl-[acyl-carrier-protein] synthase, KASII [hydrothermal vent metagenome]|uniref:3-oxoacyl-[acyl-carrier-protein] synthase, KASII n=1 Tax=hydrothermal vent metagenome TaxID=652676 RepID=A0A3B0SSL8_9ZZZZ